MLHNGQIEILSDSFKVHYRRTVCSTMMFIIFVMHLVLASHLWAQPTNQPASPQPPAKGLEDPTVLLQLIILVTTLFGFAYTIYRENRNRKWDLQDREWAREQSILRQKRMKRHVTATGQEVLKQVGNVEKKVDANTILTVATAEKVAEKNGAEKS